MRTENFLAARAEALFASALSSAAWPTPAEAAAAIRGAIGRHGGLSGCTAEMAAAYGTDPELAAARMRWALAVARTLVTDPATMLSTGAGHPFGHAAAA